MAFEIQLPSPHTAVRTPLIKTEVCSDGLVCNNDYEARSASSPKPYFHPRSSFQHVLDNYELQKRFKTVQSFFSLICVTEELKYML